MAIDPDFLTRLILDLKDVVEDVQFDIGSDSVPEGKLRDIIKHIEEKQDEI
jgi:hypothetical protein